MNDLKFDLNTNDLAVENGDLVIVSGKDNLTQRIKDMLQSKVGDFVYDISNGLPWIDITQKKYSLQEIQVLIKTTLLTDSEILAVNEIIISEDNANELIINIKLTTVYGNLEVVV